MRAIVLERTIALLCSLSATMLLSILPATAWSATATINPSQDNTISGTLPDNSSGACDSIFSGMTDEDVILPLVPSRRALLQFDIAEAIPPGSTINSVTLGMTVTRGENHADSTYTLHRVLMAWGEGANTCGPKGGGQGEPALAGATTWLSAMHDQAPAWGTPGGDYIATASGSTLVNDTAPVWPSTPTLVSDVQDWLDGTTPNHGWILIGDEANPTTARRFDSREGISKPALVVDFTPDGPVEACCESDGDCSLTVPGQCSDTPLPGVDSCEPNQCPQPTGACCNLDETCSDTVDRLVCENAGGIFQDGSSTCSQGNVDCGLTPFVEALPIPPVLQPDNPGQSPPRYTISVQEATQGVHPELPATNLWTYNGAWPASTIVAVKGQPIEVTYVNNLPAGGGGKRGNNILEVDTCAHGPNDYGNSKRIVTHLHGGHVPARFDGQPEYHILPGETDVYEYPNNQDAGTVWYHDHALGITRLNVYSGMAGFYLIADEEDTLGVDNAFGFPSGQYEIGMAIQDRQFNPDGSLFYKAQLEDAFKGDKLLVNGKVWPYLMVDKGKYRFRILNGSQSRDYSLRLENITDPGNDPDFTLVGTDLGLISAPIDLGNDIGIQAPAERMDVVVDFAGYPAGTEIILRNDELTPPLLPNVMKFIVTDQPGYTGTLATTLRNVPDMPESSADVTRYFRLKKETNQECKDGSGRLINEWLVESLDGPNGNVIGKHWDDLSDFPILGSREVWEFENPTNSMHPMHVHLVRFQIISKETIGGQPIALEPWEANTWKDIVRIPANTRARIIMDFEDYLGKFPQHCHILDHEDHEMMRQFQTTNDPSYCNNNGTCDPGEDCVSCAADCTQVSGASCGNGLCEGGDGENCVNCPVDCGGKQSGSASKIFCCGYDDGQVTNPVGCGVDIDDDRCIDAGANLFCRESTRVSACCGDALCEGAETVASCSFDCTPGCPRTQEGPPTALACADSIDNDCDGLIDSNDSDCIDSDGDGLSNTFELLILGTDPNSIDTDGDGLVDGNDGVVSVGEDDIDIDVNGDGFIDGELTEGTDPTKEDSDGDLLEDGLEVAKSADPLDPDSWPHLFDGDVAPYGAPDNLLNAGDLTVAIRLALGLETTRPLELAHGDLGTPDGIINAADVILLIQMLHSQPSQ